MFAESGAKLPPCVGTKRPEDVARAVVKAIESNRAELDVAPLPLRAGAVIAALAPGPSARSSAASARPRPPRNSSGPGGQALARGRAASRAAAERPRRPARAVLVGERRGLDAHDDLFGVHSSSAIVGSPRTGVLIASSIAWTSLGLTSGRRRARRSTEAGSRSGTTAADRTTLLGTITESPPWANVV